MSIDIVAYIVGVLFLAVSVSERGGLGVRIGVCAAGVVALSFHSTAVFYRHVSPENAAQAPVIHCFDATPNIYCGTEPERIEQASFLGGVGLGFKIR